jgi:hypothetical protein
MAVNAESVIVEADMTAFEFFEASWRAEDHRADPPDPADLSDRALHVVMAYPADELPLPTAATQAVELERRRRGLLLSHALERPIALTAMAILSLVAIVVAWLLLSG